MLFPHRWLFGALSSLYVQFFLSDMFKSSLRMFFCSLHPHTRQRMEGSLCHSVKGKSMLPVPQVCEGRTGGTVRGGAHPLGLSQLLFFYSPTMSSESSSDATRPHSPAPLIAPLPAVPCLDYGCSLLTSHPTFPFPFSQCYTQLPESPFKMTVSQVMSLHCRKALKRISCRANIRSLPHDS